MIERSREAEAFLSAVDATDPAAVSACEGWTTHEVAAHVTGIAVEVIRHLEPYLSGDPVPGTRSFEEQRMRGRQPLHRWDIAGDDETSYALLGQDELVGHSVGELGRILLRAGRSHDPDPASDFTARLHSHGQRDLRVLVTGGDATLAWADDHADEPAVDIDGAARHVFIWGRRPDQRGRLRSHLSQPDLARLQALLSGY